MMSADTLALIAGSILSLLFSYIPNLQTKYAALDATLKRGIMLVLIVLAALGIVAISCISVLKALLPDGWAIVCDSNSIVGFVRVVIWAVIANQGTFGISPEAPAVQKVKALKALKAQGGMAQIGTD